MNLSSDEELCQAVTAYKSYEVNIQTYKGKLTFYNHKTYLF